MVLAWADRVDWYRVELCLERFGDFTVKVCVFELEDSWKSLKSVRLTYLGSWKFWILGYYCDLYIDSSIGVLGPPKTRCLDASHSWSCDDL